MHETSFSSKNFAGIFYLQTFAVVFKLLVGLFKTVGRPYHRGNSRRKKSLLFFVQYLENRSSLILPIKVFQCDYSSFLPRVYFRKRHAIWPNTQFQLTTLLVPLKLIVFTVNEHKNICKAAVNRRAAFATVCQLLKLRKWLKRFTTIMVMANKTYLLLTSRFHSIVKLNSREADIQYVHFIQELQALLFLSTIPFFFYCKSYHRESSTHIFLFFWDRSQHCHLRKSCDTKCNSLLSL